MKLLASPRVKQKYRPILYGLTGVFGFAALLLAFRAYQLPVSVWIPVDSGALTAETAASTLPVKSESVITKYGRAIKLTTFVEKSAPSVMNNPMVTIYQYQANPLLQASECPNISAIEDLSSTGCQKIGESAGQSVYKVSRSLASTRTEYYMTQGSTFIYISHTDNRDDFEYLSTFKSVARKDINQSLLNNASKVGI